MSANSGNMASSSSSGAAANGGVGATSTSYTASNESVGVKRRGQLHTENAEKEMWLVKLPVCTIYGLTYSEAATRCNATYFFLFGCAWDLLYTGNFSVFMGYQ